MLSQKVITAKSTELHQWVDQLLTIVADGLEQQTPIHEVESQTLKILLRMGHTTLQLLVDCQGDGDMGEQYQLPDGKMLQRLEGLRIRPYLSIFGDLPIERYVYAQRQGQKLEFAAVDARLALPESKFSYLLQDWDQSFAMEQPFAKVQQTIEKILGLQQPVDSLERVNRQMARQVEDFHAQQRTPPAQEEGEILVETADDKGVPIRRPADATAIDAHRHQPGPKPDRKKMATVGSVFSIDPFYRTPEEVVESLFRDPAQRRPGPKRPRPKHKRMRAMLNHVDQEGNQIDARPAIFGWMSDEVAARGVRRHKAIVCIMDGQKSLWEMRDVFQGNVEMVDVLDLLHVTPRLWEAASLFYPQGSRAAERLVRDRILRILRGEVKAVIRGLRRMGSEKLSGRQRANLEKICNFFENNRDRMRYDEYLARGYPIASGVIEGTCRNVVKDRLERTGMNWVIEGAEAMLGLRCIYLSEQWDAFITYRIKKETKRLYPYRETLDPIHWSLAV